MTLILLAALCAAFVAAFLTLRFSPYEAYRLSGEPQRVGLIAFVDDAKADLAAAMTEVRRATRRP